MGHVLAVVGAQYGSEGKGVIVHHIADRYQVHVRVGGPNAGHSFYYEGEKWSMQVIPCGWTNPLATLVLGRGMLINPEILLQELEKVQKVDPDIRSRLRIDPQAGVLDPRFHRLEGGVEGELHARIGSTGEGVGMARIARIERDPTKFQHVADVADYYGIRDMLYENTPAYLYQMARSKDKHILLEGTQGSGLSLIHGSWPYVTSHDTNAAQLVADAGISPRFVDQVLLVARTYPIRVAGNSGPLRNELTWDEMSRRLNKPTEERTTVTKKVRRIGEWDEQLMERAVVLNRPSSIALTFIDYLSPQDEGKVEYEDLSNRSKAFVTYVEKAFGVPVRFIGTGGENWEVINRGGRL